MVLRAMGARRVLLVCLSSAEESSSSLGVAALRLREARVVASDTLVVLELVCFFCGVTEKLVMGSFFKELLLLLPIDFETRAKELMLEGDDACC